MIRGFFGSFVSFWTGALLALVYMVMFLLEEKRLTNFVLKLAPAGKKARTRDAIRSAREVTTQYLVGRLWLIGILSVLYAVGFWAFGLPYAIPIALFVALFSIIPYIGNIIGGGIAVLVGLATGAGTTAILGVLGTMATAQLLESYVLTPWIMGQKVALNPLATLAAVIGFSGLWGISGAILAIPIVGMTKTIFDHLDELTPYGYLLGLREADEATNAD